MVITDLITDDFPTTKLYWNPPASLCAISISILYSRGTFIKK